MTKVLLYWLYLLSSMNKWKRITKSIFDKLDINLTLYKSHCPNFYFHFLNFLTVDYKGKVKYKKDTISSFLFLLRKFAFLIEYGTEIFESDLGSMLSFCKINQMREKSQS